MFVLGVKASFIGFYANTLGWGWLVGGWVSATPFPPQRNKIKQYFLSDSIFLKKTLCIWMCLSDFFIWTWQGIRWPPYSQLISHVSVQPCYSTTVLHPICPFYKGMGSFSTPSCMFLLKKPPGRQSSLFSYVTTLINFWLPSLDCLFPFCSLFLLIGNRYLYMSKRETEKIPVDVFPLPFKILSSNCYFTICFSFRYHE